MNACAYSDVLAANIRAARARASLNQSAAAARMRTLGFSEWRFQTVGNIERGKRRVAAEEILALACALETTIHNLLCPAGEDVIRFPAGHDIAADSVVSSVSGRNDRAIRWKDAEIIEWGA